MTEVAQLVWRAAHFVPVESRPYPVLQAVQTVGLVQVPQPAEHATQFGVTR